jgi:hypothetical protein
LFAYIIVFLIISLRNFFPNDEISLNLITLKTAHSGMLLEKWVFKWRAEEEQKPSPPKKHPTTVETTGTNVIKSVDQQADPPFPDECEDVDCGGPGGDDNGLGRFDEPRADALLQPPEDGALMASYSVFVVEPGAPVGKVPFGRFYQT